MKERVMIAYPTITTTNHARYFKQQPSPNAQQINNKRKR